MRPSSRRTIAPRKPTRPDVFPGEQGDPDVIPSVDDDPVFRTPTGDKVDPADD